MRKLLLVLLIVLPILANAQSGQSVVKLKNGSVLKGIIKHIDPTDALTLDIAGVDIQINMSDIAEIEALREDNTQYEETQKIVEEQQQTVEKSRPKPGDPLNDFKGFLLAKGNNVYVYSEDGHLGAAGASELKRLLKADGFWNVVDYMNEAHFTINYFLYLKGRDKVSVSVSSWRSNSVMSIYLESELGLETEHTNKELARECYYNKIVPLQKKIEKGNGKAPNKELSKFTIE